MSAPSKWSEYPHKDYAHTIDGMFEKGARFDAWRRFLQPSRLNALHQAGAELYVSEYSSIEGVVNFPEGTTEAVAREVLGCLLLPAALHEPYVFNRVVLNDPRAWADLPLTAFVETDPRAVPTIKFSIHQHWRVLMEHFAFGRKQEKYVRYDTLLFRHPQSCPRFRKDGQEVAALPIAKGTPMKERREALLVEAEKQAQKWKFSILERWTIRHLNNEPQPEDDAG